MLNVRYSSAFKKDFKACVKRGYKMPLLQAAIDTLRIPAALPEKNKDHQLIGDYSGCRECHIEPDWLLIYKQTGDELQLVRTGTHSDLFGK
ncbi:MAG: type II toxin-antitoxin system YafQ family toxin [Oscillospiraceae bacterium]